MITLPGLESVLPVDCAAGVCNPRPEGWTRKLFGEVGVPGSLAMKPESTRLHTRTLVVGMKQVGREGGTWQGAAISTLAPGLKCSG